MEQVAQQSLASAEVIELRARIADLEQEIASLRSGQSWRIFDTALSHTPDFTYIFDREGRFTYVNRALLTFWQKSLDETVGKNFFDLECPPELAAKLQRQIQEVFDTRKNVRDETSYTGPNGEVGDYEYIFVPVIDTEGNVEAVTGSTRDITDQKRDRENLHKSEEQLKLALAATAAERQRWQDLLMQAPAAIAFLRGPAHVFESVNSAYLSLVGRPTADALIGKTVLEALPEIAGQRYVDLLDNVYRTGTAYVGTEQSIQLNLSGNGVLQDLYLNFAYQPSRSLTGEVEGVLIHATDVTGMVIARRRVEESAQHLRTLADSIPQLVWTCLADGNCDYLSEQWVKYTGIPEAEQLGLRWLDLVLHPDDRARTHEAWMAAVADKQSYDLEYRIRRDDGVYRWFKTRGTPLRDEKAHIVRWFGTCTDIEELRETREALQESLAELNRVNQGLQRANKDLEQFAYSASHDLQEPIRNISIFSDVVDRRYGQILDQQGREYLAFMKAGARRMEALVKDLLAFTQAGSAADFPLMRVDASRVLERALANLSAAIQESAAEIHEDSLPNLFIHDVHLQQILQNLIGNAIKYRSEARPEIHISAKETEGSWLFAVKDNGMGIAPQYQQTVFGLFRRLHNDGKYSGTGIGLALCQRLVERYGGRIWVESEVGQGSTFFFTIPATQT